MPQNISSIMHKGCYACSWEAVMPARIL